MRSYAVVARERGVLLFCVGPAVGDGVGGGEAAVLGRAAYARGGVAGGHLSFGGVLGLRVVFCGGSLSRRRECVAYVV